MDLVTGLERVKVLGFVQVPQHGGAVFAPRCAQGTVGGDGDGVDVAGVADVVGLNAAGSEFPDLERGSAKLVLEEQDLDAELEPAMAISALVIGCLMAPKSSEVANTCRLQSIL